MENTFIKKFKQNAEHARAVDTRDDNDINGYEGTIFSLGKLHYYDVDMYYRFGKKEHKPKFMYGTSRITENEFIRRVRAKLITA